MPSILSSLRYNIWELLNCVSNLRSFIKKLSPSTSFYKLRQATFAKRQRHKADLNRLLYIFSKYNFWDFKLEFNKFKISDIFQNFSEISELLFGRKYSCNNSLDKILCKKSSMMQIIIWIYSNQNTIATSNPKENRSSYHIIREAGTLFCVVNDYIRPLASSLIEWSLEKKLCKS